MEVQVVEVVKPLLVARDQVEMVIHLLLVLLKEVMVVVVNT